MTEHEWDTTSDALAMLRHLRVVYDPGPASEPGHRPEPLISAARLRAWVEADRALWGSDGAYDLDTHLLEAARVWAQQRFSRSASDAGRRAALLRCVAGSPWRPARLPCTGARGTVLYRPGDPVKLDADARCPHLTPTVLALARAAREERQGDGLLDGRLVALVADALMDAGMPEEERCGRCKGKGYQDVKNYHGAWEEWGCEACKGSGRVPHPLLAHLRSPEPHCQACHVLALVLGEEP